MLHHDLNIRKSAPQFLRWFLSLFFFAHLDWEEEMGIFRGAESSWELFRDNWFYSLDFWFCRINLILEMLETVIVSFTWSRFVKGRYLLSEILFNIPLKKKVRKASVSFFLQQVLDNSFCILPFLFPLLSFCCLWMVRLTWRTFNHN